MNLRIIAAACAIAFGSFTSQAQMIDAAITPDSTFVVDKVYAGVLSGLAYQPEAKAFSRFSYLRVGASVSWKLAKKLVWRTWAYGEYEGFSETSSSFMSSYLQYAPSKKWLIDAGVGPTLAALQHRPHPVTHFGQFEPSTKGRFPGGAPMAQVRFMPLRGYMVGAGISLRNNMPEYQFTTTIKDLQVSAFYQECTQTTGVGFSYTKGRLSTTNIWRSDDAIANLNLFTLHRKQSILLYSDFGYSLPLNLVTRFEVGFVKTMQTKYIKALVGAGWAYETKSVKSYLLVSL